MPHLRRHVDDDAAAFGDHQPRRRLRDEKGRPDVETEEKVEGRLVDLEKGLRPIEAGIVDKDVEVAETGYGVAHRIRSGDVEGQRPRLAPAGGDLTSDRGELARCPAHQHDLGAGSRERQCDSAADAAPRAGHQRQLAVETKGAVARHATRLFRPRRIPVCATFSGRPWCASEHRNRRASPRSSRYRPC